MLEHSMHAIGAIGLLALHLSSGADSIGELLEHVDSRIPIDARVGDGDALLECGETSCCWSLLVAFVDVRFDHDADDAVFAFAELIANGLCDLGLVSVVLEGVALQNMSAK